jgi:hypothetical protein
MSGNDPTGEVIGGGGEVAGQEKRGDNDNVVVAGAVDSTTVHNAHSGVVGGAVIGPETRGKVDVSNLSVNVDKAEVGSVDKDETESDEVGEVEDTNEDVQVKRDDDSSYLPGTSLGDNDDDEDDAVGGNNDNSDDMGEDESVEEVIVAEDEVGGDETITKKQQQHHETWVNNYNNMVTFYNTNGHCIAKRNVDTA